MSITRPEADRMALEFLRDGGPHTMGIIETDEDFAAAMIFIGLKSKGLVTSTNFGSGNVQYSITDSGLTSLDGQAA